MAKPRLKKADEIKKEKGLHRNIFHMEISGSRIYNLVICGFALPIICDWVFAEWGYSSNAVGLSVLIASVFLIVPELLRKRRALEPYKKTNHFIGLYSIENEEPLEADADSSLIKRDQEIAYIKKLLLTSFGSPRHKRGICIVGGSGSGKSTILNMLMYDKEKKYQFCNLSDQYEYMNRYLVDTFGKDYVSVLQESNQNIVIICDQFERYFSLSEEKQVEVKECIDALSVRKIAIIFSLREEYFLQFLYNFDINFLNNEKKDTAADLKGILSYKKYFTGKNRIGTWDENILVCQGENTGKTETKMKDQCNKAFNQEDSKKVYEKFKDVPLIQQQIAFNLIEQEKGYIASDEYKDCNMDYIMRRYFDVQLCSTKDFFNASRIMYLLSVGKIEGLAFTVNDLSAALCIMREDEREAFSSCLEKLHDCHLIMKVKHNNDNYYEISHDYIAQSFKTYSETELPRNVKAALDGFKLEYLRNREITKLMSDYGIKQKTPWKAISVLVLSFAAAILAYISSRLGWYRQVPGYVLTLSLLALLYVHEFYTNITIHYSNGESKVMAVMYFLAMICGTMAVLYPVLWLSFLGIGNFVQGSMSLVIGHDQRVLSLTRQMFKSYGIRTVTIGILLAVCPLILWGGQMAMKDEIVKAVLMGALLAYSYLTHLNKEFFYSHLALLFSSDV